jgi:phytoene synthase
VIGEMMLPILEPLSPDALAPARALGDAFQLTNFLRDIDEDLDRGRIYVPQEDIGRFGARTAFDERRATPEFVDLMRFEVERTRDLYRVADQGIELLPRSSARCIRAARVLYSRILEVIESNGYDVFTTRARVPAWQKAVMVARVQWAR